MKHALISLAGLGLFLGACASTDTGAPEAPPAPVGVWSEGEDGVMIHTASGGQCPSTLGDFALKGTRLIEVEDTAGNPRQDGLCSYQNADIAGILTAYFYEDEGRTLADEMISVGGAIAQSYEVEFLQDETESCDIMVQLVVGANDALAAMEKNEGQDTNLVINQDSGHCIVADMKEPQARTYATLHQSGGYFYKLRITTYLPTTTNLEEVDQAIITFHALQP
jgi:hypothetical protein